MDPALGITSPFHNEAKASEGDYDHAIEQITGGNASLAYWPTHSGTDGDAVTAAGESGDGELERGAKRTVCSMCGERHTIASVPKDGLYRCGVCVAEHAKEGRQRAFPVGTFKCCPTAQAEGEGGVVRCAGCGGWYHLRCVGLAAEDAGGPLQQYATLSTTKWYCFDPACCEKQLSKQLKKQRR